MHQYLYRLEWGLCILMKLRELLKHFRAIGLARFAALIFVIFTASAYQNCGQTSKTNGSLLNASNSSTPLATATLPTAVLTNMPTGPNVMTITVNGNLCSSGGQYVNELCAEVTLCAVGSTTNCQTITNILVDTSSMGLRVFKSAINSSVLSGFTNILAAQPTKTSEGSTATSLGECVALGDSRAWGQVMTADVYLAGEPYSRVPIQLIDSTFSGGDSQSSVNCNNSDVSSISAGYSGILGVGLYNADCGAGCVGSTPTSAYFACDGTVCSGVSPGHGASVSTQSQVSNPVASIGITSTNPVGKDNNGTIIMLPAVPSTGSASVTGALVLGIGTETNNIVATSPAPAVIVPNAAGTFQATINGVAYASILDTSGNAIYLDPTISIAECSGWYCPTTPANITAAFSSSSGGGQATLNFSIFNANTLFAEGASVLPALGGPGFSSFIDWGLPFYFGRTVYQGISGASTPIGNGPFWAF